MKTKNENIVKAKTWIFIYKVNDLFHVGELVPLIVGVRRL